VGDNVERNGQTYTSIQQPNTANDPETSPAFWTLTAKKGTNGADGQGLTYVVKVATGGAVTNLIPSRPLTAGTKGTGSYQLTNPVSGSDLQTCAIVATTNNNNDSRISATGTAAHTITVLTYNNLGTATDEAFSLMVTCL
jgi:hypothetical protein